MADGFGLLQIFRLRGPAAAHQEIKGEGSREDVVLMELRRGHYLPSPACGPQGLPVEAPEEEEPRLRGTQADEKGCKSGLAATGGAFKEEAVAGADLQVATLENRLAPLMVAEAEIVRLEDRLPILGPVPMGAEREGKGW